MTSSSLKLIVYKPAHAILPSETRRTWVFLDETRQAGVLDGLGSLLTKGRSMGACVCLGFQNIDGICATYGEKEGREIVGLCANKAILRCDSSETAKWASALIGEKEVLELRRSTAKGEGDSSRGFGSPRSKSNHWSATTSDSVAKREAVLSAEILSLPTTNRRNGLHGGPHYGKGPKNYIRSDERIKDDVCILLTEAEDVDASEVTVEVKDGQVLLEWSVIDRPMRRRAEELSEQVLGVRDIENKLKVS